MFLPIQMFVEQSRNNSMFGANPLDSEKIYNADKQIENNTSPIKKPKSELKVDTSSIGPADETISPVLGYKRFQRGDFYMKTPADKK